MLSFRCTHLNSIVNEWLAVGTLPYCRFSDSDVGWLRLRFAVVQILSFSSGLELFEFYLFQFLLGVFQSFGQFSVDCQQFDILGIFRRRCWHCQKAVDDGLLLAVLKPQEVILALKVSHFQTKQLLLLYLISRRTSLTNTLFHVSFAASQLLFT